MRPPRRRGRPVRLRPALLHRLEGAQHRDAETGDRPGADAQRVRPRRPRPARSPADRGRPVQGPRPGFHPTRTARGHRRVRGSREAGRLPELVELADLTGTFHCHTDWTDGGKHTRRNGPGRKGRRAQVSGYRRPFASRQAMRAGCRSSVSASNGRKSTSSTTHSAASSVSSRGPSATSSPTARSTTPTTCSPGSITWSPASTRSFGMAARGDDRADRSGRRPEPAGDDARTPHRPALAGPRRI